MVESPCRAAYTAKLPSLETDRLRSGVPNEVDEVEAPNAIAAPSGRPASNTSGPGVARSRPRAQAASASAATSRAASPKLMRRQGPALAAARCAMRVVLRCVPPPASAAANSAAVANRSAGSFSSAVSTASSTAGGIVSRRRVGAAGFSVMTLATIAWAVEPMNGGSPTSIS
jgi:hypothetical protein